MKINSDCAIVSYSATVTFAVGMLFANLVAAQQDNVGIEEVIVTAQKREESAQDISVAITALNSDMLEARQIENVNDMSKFVPNLQFGNFSSIATAAIRGIGYTNTTAGGDPGVAMHIDGVYLARPIASVFSVWDLERMEVLRGPQGTLYGRNTTGGSINFISRAPSDQREGELEVSYGDFSHYLVRAIYNVPFSDTAAGRFSLAVEDSDGYQENNVAGGTESGDTESVNFRGQVRFDASDTLDATVSVNYAKIEGVGSTSESRFAFPSGTFPANGFGGLRNFVGIPDPFVNTLFSQAFVTRPDIAAILNPRGIFTPDDVRAFFGMAPGTFINPDAPGADFSGLVNDLRPNRVNKNTRESNDQEFASFAATFTKDLAWGGTFKSITGFADMSFDSIIDLDASERQLLDLVLTESQDQVSQEFQLTSPSGERLEWILGLYYFSEDGDRFSSIFADEFDLLGALLQRETGFRVGGNIEATSYAVFGQASYDLTDTVRLTGGARFSWDEKDAVINLISPFPAFNFTTLVNDVPVSDDWSEPTGRIAVDWTPTDDLLFYAAFSRGYKSGGINLNGAPATAAYDPEFNDVFEIGMKAQFQNRYQLNVAAFHNDYEDIQVQTFGSTGAALRNAAAATITGLEIEGLVLLSDTLRLDFAVGLLDAEFDEFIFQPPGLPSFPTAPGQPATPGTPPPAVNFAGNSLSRAPDSTFSVGLEKAWYLSAGSSITLRGDYYYKDEQFFDPDNAADATAESYDNVDLRLRWDSGDGRRYVEAYGTNITDEDQIRDILISIPFLALGVDLTTYQAPREYGVRVGYRF